MGHSCDRLCEVFGVTRADQDSFAMRSHRGAKDAFEQGLMTVRTEPMMFVVFLCIFQL